MKNKGAITWLLGVCRGDRLKIVGRTVAEILISVSAVFDAWLLRDVIDSAVGKDIERFWQYAAMLVGLTLLQLGIRAYIRHITESCRSSLENRFKERLFKLLLSADYANVSAVHSGEWMNRLTSDTVVVADGMTEILPGLLGMLVKLIAAFIMLTVFLPELSGVVVVGGCVLVLLTLAFRRRLKKLHKSIQESDGELRELMTESLGAMPAIRAFGRQNDALGNVRTKTVKHRSARMKRNVFSNVCNIGFGAAMRGAYVFAALFCGYKIFLGSLSYGTFTAILQLVTQIQSPFANISGFLPKFYGMIASAERLMEVERFPSDCPDGSLSKAETEKLYTALQSIELKNVSFTYGGNSSPALDNMNLTVKKGSYVAFTGQSGCGKTTVLKLLLALYSADSGRLVLNTSEGEASLTSKHRPLFAYVPQGNVLMRGTVGQVLTFDDNSVTEEQIWHALDIACASEFVKSLEKGLDTPLSERGTGLSEGQMQRLAMARAVLSERPILLLDEATSALDEATESKLLENLRAMTDKTVIIVTHRPAALDICDTKVVFE